MVMSSNKFTKINKYFYMTEPEGQIFKYKKYCLVNNCKKRVHLIFQVKRMYYIVMIIN